MRLEEIWAAFAEDAVWNRKAPIFRVGSRLARGSQAIPNAKRGSKPEIV